MKIQLKHLWLETTNRCNSNCIFCARHWAPPSCDMDFDLFKKIVDQCPDAKVVQTQGFGEPLLYPHIVDAVKYATDAGKRVVFYTNGSLLTEELSRSLLNAGLWRIIFSVDDMTKEKYEYFRPPLKWDTLIENVERFQTMRDEGKYPTLTTVRVCETRENASYIRHVKEFWNKTVDKVTSKVEVDIPSPVELREAPYINGPAVLDCPFPYKYLSVKSNGDLVICCRDWFHVYVVGNVHDTELQILYRSQKFDSFREAHQTGINLPLLCHICKIDRTPTRHNK